MRSPRLALCLVYLIFFARSTQAQLTFCNCTVPEGDCTFLSEISPGSGSCSPETTTCKGYVCDVNGVDECVLVSAGFWVYTTEPACEQQFHVSPMQYSEYIQISRGVSLPSSTSDTCTTQCHTAGLVCNDVEIFLFARGDERTYTRADGTKFRTSCSDLTANSFWGTTSTSASQVPANDGACRRLADGTVLSYPSTHIDALCAQSSPLEVSQVACICSTPSPEPDYNSTTEHPDESRGTYTLTLNSDCDTACGAIGQTCNGFVTAAFSRSGPNNPITLTNINGTQIRTNCEELTAASVWDEPSTQVNSVTSDTQGCSRIYDSNTVAKAINSDWTQVCSHYYPFFSGTAEIRGACVCSQSN